MSSFPQIRAVVFDLEFTAWEGSVAHRWSRPGEFTELVQIGAVLVDAQTFTVEREMDLLVKPRLNPVLSDYLVQLTGKVITNEELAARAGSISRRPIVRSSISREARASRRSGATI